jgi:hypothetical protein
MYHQSSMSEADPLLHDPRFQPQRVLRAVLDGQAICVSHVASGGEDTAARVGRIGALVAADRLRWLTRAEALVSGRTHCDECGGSLDSQR